MELTVQNVFGLLLRSKLLSVEDCRAMFTRWQTEAKDTANVATSFPGFAQLAREVGFDLHD